MRISMKEIWRNLDGPPKKYLFMGRQIDPYGGPIELFLVPANAPQLVLV